MDTDITGYNIQCTNNNLTFTIVQCQWFGASLKVVIDENGSLIVNDNGELEDGNHTLVGGTGYALSDLIIAQAPFLYEEDQPFILRARAMITG